MIDNAEGTKWYKMKIIPTQRAVCVGCCFLKGDDCTMPLDFDYKKFGNCGFVS